MARTSFDIALTAILKEEGGYADHPSDPGGATMMGITRATLADWRGRPVSKAEVRALGREEAAAIYSARYWQAISADDLPAGLDLALFDFAVNSGPSRAVRMLQRALGVTADGVLGPVTLSALRSKPVEGLITQLCALRRRFLAELPTAKVFGAGWQRRVSTIENKALALARQVAPTPSIQPKETIMDETKPFYLSKTVWVNLIGLASIALSVFGVSTTGLDASAFADSILQAIAAISFIASSVFRVVATKRLS